MQQFSVRFKKLIFFEELPLPLSTSPKKLLGGGLMSHVGLVPNLEFVRINTGTQVFVMLKLPYTKSGDKLLKTNFLACPIRMGG